MEYELMNDVFTGKVSGIMRLSDRASIPICEGNTDYQEFLKWNSEQEKPLDLNSNIEVIAPEPVRDFGKEIDDINLRIDNL